MKYIISYLVPTVITLFVVFIVYPIIFIGNFLWHFAIDFRVFPFDYYSYDEDSDLDHSVTMFDLFGRKECYDTYLHYLWRIK